MKIDQKTLAQIVRICAYEESDIHRPVDGKLTLHSFIYEHWPNNKTEARSIYSPVSGFLRKLGYQISAAVLVDEWTTQHNIRNKRKEDKKVHCPLDIQFRHLARLKEKAVDACPGSEAGVNFTIRDAQVVDHDVANRLWVLHVSGVYPYTRTNRRFVQSSWLAGHDPDQPENYFCRRIPGTIRTVADALEWLKPAEVKRAEDEGKKVLRQGDVYLVEGRIDNMSNLPVSHRWEPETRMLHHPEHKSVNVTFKAKAIPQKRINGMGAD